MRQGSDQAAPRHPPGPAGEQCEGAQAQQPEQRATAVPDDALDAGDEAVLGVVRCLRQTAAVRLHAQRPDDELFFITGADALAQILSWKDADELFDLAHFIGVTRPGHELSDKGLPANGVTLQEVPAMAISSTDCRARVERAEPVWYLVPDGVVQYINKYSLYTAGAPTAAAHRT